MFLTKKHLSRRTLLKGAGVSLALPLLDAMIPAATALSQTAAARKVRAGFFYLPHGMIMNNTALGAAMDRWTPSGSGADFKLNTITKSLEPYKKYVTTLGNIKNDAAQGIHTRNAGTWLSGEAPGSMMSPTLDQVIADRISSGTRLRSLEVASESTVQQRSGNGGPYSVLSHTTTPLQMEYNSRKVFLKLFYDENARPITQESERENASLLDLINSQTRALQRDLGPSDRAILDSHLTAVREVEQRVEQRNAAAEALGRTGTRLPPMPPGPLAAFDEQVKLMFEMIAIAYQMDVTRVVAFMMAAEGTNRTYDHIGVPDSFHPLSHHANDPARIEKLVKIQTWHMECFAEFLGKLAAVRDGDGTLLDNAIFLYGSNMSNSDRHSTHPLPTLLVGGAGGKLTGGRHLELPSPTPIANLHLTLLGTVGIQRNTFGDSTGTVAL
jgi:hypothetical protein